MITTLFILAVVITALVLTVENAASTISEETAALVGMGIAARYEIVEGKKIFIHTSLPNWGIISLIFNLPMMTHRLITRGVGLILTLCVTSILNSLLFLRDKARLVGIYLKNKEYIDAICSTTDKNLDRFGRRIKQQYSTIVRVVERIINIWTRKGTRVLVYGLVILILLLIGINNEEASYFDIVAVAGLASKKGDTAMSHNQSKVNTQTSVSQYLKGMTAEQRAYALTGALLTDDTFEFSSEAAEYLNVSPQKCVVTHYELPVYVDLVEEEGVEYSQTVVGEPRLNKDMKDPVEFRICLAPASGIDEAMSITLSVESDNVNLQEAFKDKTFKSQLKARLKEMGIDLMGGTSLNRGIFYAFSKTNHGMKYAHEATGYVSLWFTPIVPGMYFDKNISIKVVTVEDMRKTGLTGDGGCLGFDSFGQFRAILNDGKSVAKGCIIGFTEAENVLMLDIPEEWKYYQLVVTEDDVKINTVKAGVYSGSFGITYDNLWTVKGQEVALGFEFWQFMSADDTIHAMLADRIKRSTLPGYEEMVMGLQRAKALAAHSNGEEFEMFEVDTKLLASLATLGSGYRWVANQLEATIVNYMFTKPFKGTEYRISITVTDEHALKIDAIRESETGEYLLGKYPVVAGIAKVTGRKKFGKWVVAAESLALTLNFDSDGDGLFTFMDRIATKLIENGCVEPLVDMEIDKKAFGRRTDKLTMDSMLSQAVTIMESSSKIGFLTNGYYRAMIANMHLGMDIDVSMFFKTIELSIKGAKYNTDAQMKQNMRTIFDALAAIKEAEGQALSDMVTMNWNRGAKRSMMKEFNSSRERMDERVSSVLEKKVQNPLHYMDAIWNLTLERVEGEILKLRSGVKSFSDFATMIPIPSGNPDRIHVKEIEAMRRAYGETRPDGLLRDRSADVCAVATGMAPKWSVGATQILMKEYLEKVREDSLGGFFIHACYGKYGWVLGKTDAYSVKPNGKVAVRLWQKGEKITKEDMPKIIFTGGMFKLGDNKLNVGDGYTVDPALTIKTTVPMVAWDKKKKKNDYTNSCFVLLEKPKVD